MGLSAASVGPWWASLVGRSISLIGLCLLGSSLRAGALGFIGTRKKTLCFSGPLRVCLSSRYIRPVLECSRGWCLVPSGGSRFPRRASASAAAAARARRAIGRAFSAFVCGLRAVPLPLGVRCALFSVFVGVGCFSGVNKNWPAFWWGFAFVLRLRASPLTILPPREEACRQLQLFTYRYRPKRSCLNQSTDLTVGVR